MHPIDQAPSVGLFRSLLWPAVRPWRWWLVLAIALNAGHGLAITFQTLLPKYLIDEVIKPGPDGLWERLSWLVGTYLIVSVFGRMVQWHLSMRIFTWVREKAMQDLRGRFFSHVNRLCLRFHGRNESGELFNYLFGSPIGKLQAFLSHVTLAKGAAPSLAVSASAWPSRERCSPNLTGSFLMRRRAPLTPCPNG